jgi:hypothetical protein
MAVSKARKKQDKLDPRIERLLQLILEARQARKHRHEYVARLQLVED